MIQVGMLGCISFDNYHGKECTDSITRKSVMMTTETLPVT